MSWPGLLDRNPLDDVTRDLAFRVAVEPGCAGVGVAEEVLDVLQRHTLGDQVRGRRGAKRVTAQIWW